MTPSPRISPRQSMAAFKARIPVAPKAPEPERPGVEKFKTDNAYDRSAPRCGSCKSFKPPRTVLRNSLPAAHVSGFCRAGGFSTCEHAVCDAWHGRDGSTLFPTPLTAQEAK